MKSMAIKTLIACIAVLLTGLVFLWLDSHGHARNTHWAPPTPLEPDLTGLASGLPDPASPDLSQFLATLERPLFSATRRPPLPVPVVPVKADPPPDPLANIHIFGIFGGAAGSGMLARVDGKVQRIAVNETFGGWTLKAVQGREATVVRDGEERILHLDTIRGNAAKPAAPTAASKPPPANPDAALLTIGNTSPASPSASAPSPNTAEAPKTNDTAQSPEDVRRERLRRRNELRAKAGASPISE